MKRKTYRKKEEAVNHSPNIQLGMNTCRKGGQQNRYAVNTIAQSQANQLTDSKIITSDEISKFLEKKNM